MCTRELRRLALALAVLLALVVPAGAQSQATTGVIEGTVLDESGAPAPGATVALRNTATNFEQVVTDRPDGRFRGLLLPLGPYRVTVALDGFRPWSARASTWRSARRSTSRSTLKVRRSQEEITVTGEAPVIETTRTEGAVRIDEAAIEGLPNNGRNFLDFTKLTPGVTIVQGPDGDELSINGQKGISNNISVDGADFNNPFFGEQRGGQRPPFTFNLDAVQEVVVVADGAPAEFGRSSGGFVNVITKSGTNRSTAASTASTRTTACPRRRNPDGSTRREGRLRASSQGGFTLGGPLAAGQALLLHRRRRPARQPTKQTDPTRMDPRLVAFLARIGAARRERADRAHRRRRGGAGQARLAGLDEQPGHLPLQLHRLRAGQRHLRRRPVGALGQRHRAGLLARRSPAR